MSAAQYRPDAAFPIYGFHRRPALSLRLKRQVRNVANGARNFAMGLRRRMNAMGGGDGEDRGARAAMAVSVVESGQESTVDALEKNDSDIPSEILERAGSAIDS